LPTFSVQSKNNPNSGVQRKGVAKIQGGIQRVILKKLYFTKCCRSVLHSSKQQQFHFFYLNASTLNNTDTVRPGGGEKTLRSSRLPPPKKLKRAKLP